jgi:hypothetical protein
MKSAGIVEPHDSTLTSAKFGAKNASDYLQVGRDIMQNGSKVEYLYKGEARNGYVQFMGNTSKGNAKFGFVGTNADGALTTIHIESGNSFWKMLNGDSSIRTITPVHDLSSTCSCAA